MLLNKLLKAIQPVQVTGESDIEITGINIDSRLLEAGQLFMAMRGTQARSLGRHPYHSAHRADLRYSGGAFSGKSRRAGGRA